MREKFRKDMCESHKLRWKDGKKMRCMGYESSVAIPCISWGIFFITLMRGKNQPLEKRTQNVFISNQTLLTKYLGILRVLKESCI